MWQAYPVISPGTTETTKTRVSSPRTLLPKGSKECGWQEWGRSGLVKMSFPKYFNGDVARGPRGLRGWAGGAVDAVGHVSRGEGEAEALSKLEQLFAEVSELRAERS